MHILTCNPLKINIYHNNMKENVDKVSKNTYYVERINED